MRTRQKRLLLLICVMVFLLLCTTTPSFADVIIDNGGTGTSYTGSWPLSGGTSPYGASSLWSRNGATYTFAMSGQSPGTYEVLMWWSGWSSRATSVPVAINYTGGTSNITINQQQNPGQWNSLGTFYFDGSGSVMITAANGDTLSTCAGRRTFPGCRRGNAEPFEGRGTCAGGYRRCFRPEQRAQDKKNCKNCHDRCTGDCFSQLLFGS